jgi:hypothetical protein
LPNNKRTRDDAGDDSSEDIDPADPKIALGTDDQNQNAPPKKAPRPQPNDADVDNAGGMDDDEDEDEDEDTIERKKAEAEEFREEKLAAFLNDPEKSMMIFLSSYMREQGMIW